MIYRFRAAEASNVMLRTVLCTLQSLPPSMAFITIKRVKIVAYSTRSRHDK